MTTTDTAPLSARLRDRANDILDHMPSNLLVVAADALDALSARVASQAEELEGMSQGAAELDQENDRLKRRLAELEAALTAAQDEATASLTALTDEQVIAQAVADYGSAEAAVKATHDVKARIIQTAADHWKARATQAEAERDRLALAEGAWRMMLAQAESDLAASQAREAGLRDALDDIHGMASAAIGPNCGAGPDLIRIAKRAQEAAALDQPTAQRGAPLIRVEQDGAVVRGIRIEPCMTAAQINAACDAAMALPAPAQGADIAREVAEEAVALLKQATETFMAPGTTWELDAYSVLAKAIRAGLTAEEVSNG